MADITKSIQIVIDATANGAKSTLAGLKQNVSEAEGSFGKLKAGAGGVFDTIKQAGPLALAGVGAAISGFAVKAIGDFEDLGISAGQFSDAAKISTEDASRWIEVASDLGVETDAVQGAMQRLNREADQGKLAKFGITAQDSNERLIQTLKYLQSIPDEAVRAQAQFELLGKGGAALEPLIASAGQLDDRLKSVSGNKIITKEDAQQAEDLRDALDNVSDAVDNVELGLAKKLAPALKQAADAAVGKDGQGGLLGALGDIGDKAGDINQALASPIQALSDHLPQSVHDAVAEIPVLNQAVSDNTSANKEAAAATDANAEAQSRLAGEMGPLAKHYQDRINATNGATTSTDLSAEADKQAAAAADALAASEKELTKQINAVYDAATKNTLSQLDAQNAVIETNAKLQEYGKTLADTKLTTDQQTLAQNQMEAQIINTSVKVAEATTANEHFGSTQEETAAKIGLQVQNLQAVQATLDPSSSLYQAISGYIAHLNEIQTGVTTTVSANMTPAEQAVRSFIESVAQHPAYIDVVGRTSPQGQARALGGPVEAGVPITVGEWGKETFVPPSDGTIIPHGKSIGSTTNLTINVNGGGPGVAKQVLDELTWAMRTGRVEV